MTMESPRKRPAQHADAEEGVSRKRGRAAYREEPLLKLLIPNVVAGHLIGKGGSYLSELKSKYGGHIVLSGNREFFPGTEERVVVVTGKVSELIDLNYYIMDNVLNTGREPLRDGRGEITKIVVTNEGAGSLIGKKGATMKQIVDESGAKVMIADSIGDIVHGDRILTMRGTLEQRHEAAKIIIQKIADEPSNMANTRTKYRNIDIPNGGDGRGTDRGFRDGAGGGFRDERRVDLKGGSFDNGLPGYMRDHRDRKRDVGYQHSSDLDRVGDTNFLSDFDRMFSYPSKRNDYEGSVVGLIETAAAAMDKQQILAALTGTSTSGRAPPAVASRTDKKRPRHTLKHSLELKVEVPTHSVGHLMGKGGKTVKDMVRRSHGARFAFEDVSRAGESESGDKRDQVRTLTVTGTFEQVESAFDVIHEKMEELDQYHKEFKPRDY